MSTELTCRVCHTSLRSRDTGLRTCEDARQLGEYAVYYCDACGNGFTTPDIPPSQYELPTDVSTSELNAGTDFLLRWFVRRRVDKLDSLMQQQNSTLLDVGGGACAFANASAARGYSVTVIEPNEKNRAYADAKKDVRFISEMFSQDLINNGVLKRNSFDAITMWHALEHTRDPGEALETAHALLKPGGLLFVSVPNFSGLQARFGRNYWTYLDVPHHLCHFTHFGLQGLMKKCGFSLIRSYRFSVEYDPFGWYQTLLNVLGRSHNYFYNKTKKHRTDDSYLRYPTWTKAVTAIGPVLLPVVAILSLVTIVANSPACVELAVVKEPR